MEKSEPSSLNLTAVWEDCARKIRQTISGLTKPHIWLSKHGNQEPECWLGLGLGAPLIFGDVVTEDEHLTVPITVPKDALVDSLDTFQLKHCCWPSSPDVVSPDPSVRS
jgi:hypothetical protein